MIDGSPHRYLKEDQSTQQTFLPMKMSTIFQQWRHSDNGNSFPIMFDITFSLNGIQQTLCNLQVNKASGPDRIPPYILKNCAEEISPVLKVIFTKSFTFT